MMKNGFDPKTGLWLNVAFLILTGVGVGSVTFAGLGPTATDIIKSYCADAAFGISCVNLVFGFYVSTAAGPGVINK